MTRTRTAATLALFGTLLVPRASVAQDATHAAQVSQCSLRAGKVELPIDLPIYQQFQGGKAFAKFTGTATEVTAQHFPFDAKHGRTSVRGGSGFWIEGFVDPAQLPLYTTREIPVPGGVVWLGEDREVRQVGASASDLSVEMILAAPMRDTFAASAPCSAFALAPGVPPAWPVPGDAQGYVVTEDQVELYASAEDRTVVTTIDYASGLLMWNRNRERRNGLAHVEYHGEVVIDAWAKVSAFRVLPPGETEDHQNPPTSKRVAPRLTLSERPREVTTGAQVTIRSAARTGGPVVGSIEPGTAIYVMDIVAGWASVLPRALDVVPTGDVQFWVKASDLGLGAK
jgi:hypothetical protein